MWERSSNIERFKSDFSFDVLNLLLARQKEIEGELYRATSLRVVKTTHPASWVYRDF